MARRTWAGRRRAAGRWLVRLVELVLGVWIASVLVAGLTLALWPDVVLVATAFLALLTLATRALGALEPVDRAVGEWIAERGLDAPSEWRYCLMLALWWVCHLAVLAVHGALRVGLLWLVVRTFGAIGLSSRLEGIWPSVTATVVLVAGAALVRWLRLLALASLVPRRRAQLSWSAAELPLTAVALGGGVLLLPGVELGAELGLGAQLLALGVLAVVVTSVRLEFTVPFLVLASTLVVNGVKLWLVGLLGAWMTVTLRIDGLLSLAALALLVTALGWPAVRVRRARAARQRALAAMEDQQAMDMMQMAANSRWVHRY